MRERERRRGERGRFVSHTFFLDPPGKKKSFKLLNFPPGACQVDVLSTNLLNSVAQGTSKWADIPDIIANIAVSDMIPCFTDPTFFNTFRGGAFIDGGFCSDFAELCPKSTPGSKCLKSATTFLGPSLRGTPMPTVNSK